MTRRHIAALLLPALVLASCGAPTALTRRVSMPPVRVLSAPTTPTTTAPAPPPTTAPVTTTTAPRVAPTPTTTTPTPTPTPTTAPPVAATPTPTTPTAVLAAAISRYVPPATRAYLARIGWTWTIGVRPCAPGATHVSLGCTWDTGPPSSQFSPGLVAAGPAWTGWIVTHEAAAALLLSTLHAPVSSWSGAGGWAAQFAGSPTARGAPYSPYDAAAGCLSKAWGAPMEAPPDTPIPCPAATAAWVAAQVAQAVATTG